MHVEVYMLYDLLTMFEQRPISWYHTGNPEEDVVPCFLATMALSCTCTLCRACRLYRQLEDPCFVKFSADGKLTPMPVYRNVDGSKQSKGKSYIGYFTIV